MKKELGSVGIGKTTAALAALLLVAMTAVPAVAQSTGSLRVTIGPQEAVDDGAMWRLTAGNTTWQQSGATLSNIYQGTYTVEFRDVYGWSTPASRTVAINTGRTALLNVTYQGGGQRQGQVRGEGALIIYIDPPEAIDAGAMWRLQGSETWLRSGEADQYAPAGQSIVEFTDLKGWERPADQTVNVIRGRTATLNVSYTPMWGSLSVTIEPHEAADAGAMWRRQGTDIWLRSGETENEVPTGDYTIEFSSVKYWVGSSAAQVSIESSQTTSLTASYQRQKGFLTVNIEPAEAITGGAEWKLKGEDDWHRSGRVLQNAPAGEVIVQFKSIAGWNRPEDMVVTVDPQRPTTTSAIYVREKGSVTVDIEPQEAAEAGAKWRIAEEGYDWRVSGNTKSNLPTGMVTIEFKDVDGWETPAPQKVRLIEGQELTIKGRYQPMRGSLAVNIEPQGAIDAGAEWRIVGTPNWHRSGRLREGLRFGELVIEFKGIAEWNAPDKIALTLNPGDDQTVTGTYKAQRRATLTVTIEPNRAAREGAMWRIAGSDAWLQSGETAENVTPGQVTVEFKNVEGWKKPDQMVVSIGAREEAKVTATYERKR
jgi:hypothetical protein